MSIRNLLRLTTLVGCLVVAACGDDGVRHLPDAPVGPNDRDGDGVPDDRDNCPDASNADQVDADHDGMGDACDTDKDNDGIPDADDNCPLVANPTQGDANGDGTGDACQDDADGDGVPNGSDNCPLAANDDQMDVDGDGLGDACDPDNDNDGINNVTDNCPLAANVDQADFNADGMGDTCQDSDGDGLLDAVDNCQAVSNAGQENNDGDALGDACDDDDDNDGIADVDDNCPTVANADQSNLDGDGQGDACDSDDDNDGVPDANDNCPTVSNPGQEDGNGNGHGDACDGTVVPVVSGIIRGGNIASVGAGMAGRFDSVVDPAVNLTITTVPATAHVLKAFLYWTVIGTAFPTVTFQGNAANGTEIGQTGDTCWGIGNNFMYRADVTAAVPGNGTYVASDLLSTVCDGTGCHPDGQGISLVVIYQDAADLRNNLISINDGAVGFVSGSEVATSIATGFTVGNAFDKATAINLVADGQPAGDSLQVQGVELGNGDAFQGLDGAMWDNRVDDVTALISAGTTSVSTRVAGGGDCLAWSFSGLVIENVDHNVAAEKVVRRPARTPAMTLVKKPVILVPARADGRGTTRFTPSR